MSGTNTQIAGNEKNMFARFGLLIAMGVWFLVPAHAETVLLFDDFDSYANQAALNAAWPAFSTQQSGTISTEQSESSPNSVKFAAVTAAQGNGPAQRNIRFFTETGLPSATNPIHLEYDFFDTDATASAYRQYTGLIDSSAATGNGGLIQLGLNNNQSTSQSGGNYYMGRILGYNPGVDGEDVSGASAFFKLNGAQAPLRSTGWHTLGVTISNADYKFYVDGILSRTVTNNWTLRSYDEILMGSGLANAGNAAYVDNVKVATGLPGLPMLPGDFNFDGMVDAADYVVWRKGPTDTQSGYDVWQRNFGRAANGGGTEAAVPEPASAVLLVVAGAALAARSRVSVKGRPLARVS